MEMKQNGRKELLFDILGKHRHLFWIRLLFAGLASVAVSTSEVLAAQAPAYIFTDLGRVGDLSSEANAISADGVVAGSIMYNASGTTLRRAFYYYQGVRHFDFIASTQKMISTAHAVNASGCVVGSTQAVKDLAPIYLSVWKGAETCPFNDSTYISTGLGGSNTTGHAINSNNLVVGSSETASDEYHAFSMTLGVAGTTDMGTLPGGWGSAALAVNDDGVSVGYSSSSTAVQTATRWEEGVPVNLGAFPGASAGTQSYAFAINNLASPQIVGWSHGPDAVGHPHAFIWQDGVMEDLGTLSGGDWSEAFGVNDYGDTVGWARGADYHVYAVLWIDGGIIDLNTVDGIPPGWVLAEARGINNIGQIVGRGVFQGMERAFLITPVAAFSNIFNDGLESGDTRMWSSVVP